MIPFFIKKNKNESFNFLDINRYNESINNMNSYSKEIQSIIKSDDLFL